MVRSEPSLSDYPQATGRSSPFTFNSCRKRSGCGIRPATTTNRPAPCWGTACFGASVIKRAAMRRAVTKIAEKSPPSLCMMKFKCFDEKRAGRPYRKASGSSRSQRRDPVCARRPNPVEVKRRKNRGRRFVRRKDSARIPFAFPPPGGGVRERSRGQSFGKTLRLIANTAAVMRATMRKAVSSSVCRATKPIAAGPARIPA